MDDVFSKLGRVLLEGFREEDYDELLDAIKSVREKALGEDGDVIDPMMELDADKEQELSDRGAKDPSLRVFTLKPKHRAF